MTTMHHGDILEWAASYDGPPFHALLCDAPYEMREIGPEEVELILQRLAYRAQEKGFMGRDWDGSGIAFLVATWAALARHLLPGAFLFVFAGTVNDDLISVAMRGAGLRKHHKMLSWSYGQGLQKSTRMDDKLDRRAGAERRVTGTRKHAPKFAAAEFGYREKDNGYNSRSRESFEITAPTTDMAQTWAGHRYGLQHLKPAVEPILVFQKPYAGGDALTSITATGAGAINIDGSKLPTDELRSGVYQRTHTASLFDEKSSGLTSAFMYDGTRGRWPANLAISHHPACDAAGCHEDCAVRRLGAQSGVSESNPHRAAGGNRMGANCYAQDAYTVAMQHTEYHGPSDIGTAARFFFNADFTHERLEQADQIGYFAKTSPAVRDAGLDPMQIALLGLLEGFEPQDPTGIYGNETPEGAAARGRKPRHGFEPTTVDDGRKTPIDNPFLRGETKRRNTHTTLKPIALTRWLATLLLPPAAYAPRRLLVPFAGVASEMIGAMLAGWDEVVGVELVEEHVNIARARLAYWQQRRHELDGGRRIAADAPPRALDGQMTIFD